MSGPIKVFLSWSGERSKALASALHRYLHLIVQRCEPWMSQAIEPGKRWGGELSDQLKSADFGIVCVTPESLDSRWLNFEAGAISKQVGDRENRVVPLLLDLEPTDVQGPLADFQMKLADRDGILDVVRSINSITDKSLPPDELTEQFDAHWPKLDKAIKSIGPARKEASPVRETEDKIDEILQRIRNLERAQESGLQLKSSLPHTTVDKDGNRLFVLWNDHQGTIWKVPEEVSKWGEEVVRRALRRQHVQDFAASKEGGPVDPEDEGK